MSRQLGLLPLIIFGSLIALVRSHGRLIEPPSRATMWRFGFDTPHDYNDHESYCGGFTRQWQRNNGKCGICGDPWDSRVPRSHETGGKYGNGVIVRRYRTGDVIPVKVELTANHQGYFEFRTCPMTFQGQEVDQDCLDQYVLRAENGTVRFYPGPGNRIFESYYKLPDGLQCSQCVFQWRYIAGNNWGDCGNGKGAVGCGPQEEFRACADIAIGDDVAPLPPRPKPPRIRTTSPRVPVTTDSNEVPSDRITYPYVLFHFVIAGTCLLVVVAIMALIYTYYYHAGQAKKWLMAKKLMRSPKNATAMSQPRPVAPPRLKKQLHSQYPGIGQLHI